MRGLVIAGLVGTAVSARLVTGNVDPAPSDPTVKITTMLNRLGAGLKADEAEELANYNKFACWVEDTVREKAKQIDANAKKIAQLTDLIEKEAADKSSRETHLGNTNTRISKLIQELADKQAETSTLAATFKKEQADRRTAIAGLQKAIILLTDMYEQNKLKGAGHSLLTIKSRTQVVDGVKFAYGLFPENAKERMSVTDQQTLMDFIQGAGKTHNAFLQAKNPFGEYESASKGITGILTQMLAEFSQDVQDSASEISDAITMNNAEQADGKRTLAALDATVEKLKSQIAEGEQLIAESKKDRFDTVDLKAMNVKIKADTEQEGRLRANERNESVHARTVSRNAINKIVKILDDDKDLFAKAHKNAGAFDLDGKDQRKPTTFLQLSKSSTDAATKIAALAKKSRSGLLSKIALQVRAGGHFDAVLVTIDEMVQSLTEQQSADLAEKTSCQKEAASLAQQDTTLKNMRTKLTLQKTRQVAKWDKLSEAIGATKDGEVMAHAAKAISKGPSGLKGDIEALETDMAAAKTQRNIEHTQYKTNDKDDADAINILETKVKPLMAEVVTQQSFLQMNQQPETTETFGSTETRGGEAGTLMLFIDTVIDDVKKEQAVNTETERTTQAAYNTQFKDNTKELNNLNDQKANKEGLKAETGEEIEATDVELTANLGQDTGYKGMKSAHDTKCSWCIKKTEGKTFFDTRKEGREEEISGLKSAKVILTNYSTRGENHESGFASVDGYTSL